MERRAVISSTCIGLVIIFAWLAMNRRAQPKHGIIESSHLHIESIGFFSQEMPFEGSLIEVKYQIPPGQVKGLLFLAHGCHHSAGDFWPKSPLCPKCLGLPEEIRIRKAAMRRGYAVVAISSTDRENRCWRGEEDVARVAHALTSLQNQTRLKGLPLYGLGASSGGMFVLMLASHSAPRFTAITSQIMALYPAEEEMELRIRHSSHPYPPTLFVHMPRDEMTARAVSECMTVLTNHNISTKEIQIKPSPLTPSYLFDSIGEEVPLEQSEAIFQAFKKHNLIDDRGFLIHNPRLSLPWREALDSLPFHQSLRLDPDASPIFEELNVLWAMHEIISISTEEVIDWFEAQLQKSITK
jgi:predicted alpha/beta-hydrolase family hydrolase